MLFQPTQADVRRFFCRVRAKMLTQQTMESIETLASLWIEEHPEYFNDLADEEGALKQNYEGKTNPFLHLSMHLSISEQCSIDQPRGVRRAVELLASHLEGGLHAAHHVAMEYLGRMLEESQRSGRPPDGQTYVDALMQRATKN